MHRPGRGGNSGRFADEIITTGATPLLHAAAGQDSEAVRLLLEYGGRVDVPNAMGVTRLPHGWWRDRLILVWRQVRRFAETSPVELKLNRLGRAGWAVGRAGYRR
jgi:ankyrin repeat protein